MNSFSENVYDSSPGITFEDTVINLPDCVDLMQGRVAGGAFTGPSRNLEFAVGTAPDGSDVYVGSLNQFYPNNENTDNTDPMVSCSLRPLEGSPLIGEQYTDPDGSPRGYRGAKAPFGDYDNSGSVDDSDQNHFMIALNKEKNGDPLTPKEKDTFWTECTGPVSVEEFYRMYQHFGGQNPTIPTVSEWGIAVLALLVCISATMVIRCRPRIFFDPFRVG
jgi:hypothetical protein